VGEGGGEARSARAAGFSALIKEDRALRWYKCVACGAFDSLRVIGKSLVIE
jgi:hypothetical protein